jgi:protein arginine kinase activator
MRCQRCSREATVHLSETVGEERRELHLCGRCAKEADLGPPPTPPAELLGSIVDHLIIKHVGELVGDLARTSCPVCGLGYMEYRTGGRLGCPHDYEAFARGLPAQIRRAQGATRHVGKAPRHRDPDAPGRLRIRAEIRAAVSREDYEQAARLRDQLRHTEAKP